MAISKEIEEYKKQATGRIDEIQQAILKCKFKETDVEVRTKQDIRHFIFALRTLADMFEDEISDGQYNN